MRELVRAAVVGVIILACLGASPNKELYEASSYVHPQLLVKVGSRHVNIYCSGAGSPTVILDSGLGGDTTDWRLVQARIARRTRVCSYDRAGMGFSDPGSPPRDASTIVKELHALLQGANIAPPYVLVGHSIAGLYVRHYTDRHPREVVGLVLVAPSTEYDEQLFRKATTAYSEAVGGGVNRFRSARCSGLLVENARSPNPLRK